MTSGQPASHKVQSRRFLSMIFGNFKPRNREPENDYRWMYELRYGREGYGWYLKPILTRKPPCKARHRYIYNPHGAQGREWVLNPGSPEYQSLREKHKSLLYWLIGFIAVARKNVNCLRPYHKLISRVIITIPTVLATWNGKVLS